jgi:plasmid stabilization system protein ParE
MLKLKWRQIARRDLDAIVMYISDDNVDAAEALRKEINAKIDGLVV